MGANKGFGTTITKGVTNIGVLTAITPPEVSADTIETTVLDSADGYRTFMQGLRDGGEVTLSGYFDGTDAGQATLKTAFDAGTADSYTITFPVAIGATWTFTGFLTRFMTGEANLDDPLSFEITLKISGKPNLGLSSSAGISAASFVQTDGTTALTAYTVTPTFANGTYNYNITYTTQTAYKAKITAASHTILMYVDGVLTETLTSGSASTTSISQGSAGTKRIDLVVYEAAKNPKTYTFMIGRTS